MVKILGVRVNGKRQPLPTEGNKEFRSVNCARRWAREIFKEYNVELEYEEIK